MMADILNKHIASVTTHHRFPKESHPLNVVPVYVINLATDSMRRKYMHHVMNAHQINYNMVMVSRPPNETAIPFGLDAGKLGCVLSHLWCLNQAVKNGHERILILEDDVLFHKEFVRRFESLLVEPSTEVLMLGALDRELSIHSQSGPLYPANQNVIGAHANIYTLSAAKRILSHKLNHMPVKEYDLEYGTIFNAGEVQVCMPNLLVCELSTSNLNHHFCPMKNPAQYRQLYRRFYDTSFTYLDYEYITIAFLKFVKQSRNIRTLEDAVNQFVLVNKCPWATEPLLRSGYSWKDVVNMTG